MFNRLYGWSHDVHSCAIVQLNCYVIQSCRVVELFVFFLKTAFVSKINLQLVLVCTLVGKVRL